MRKIKRDDEVIVVAGKDKGKRGTNQQCDANKGERNDKWPSEGQLHRVGERVDAVLTRHPGAADVDKSRLL